MSSKGIVQILVVKNQYIKSPYDLYLCLCKHVSVYKFKDDGVVFSDPKIIILNEICVHILLLVFDNSFIKVYLLQSKYRFRV